MTFNPASPGSAQVTSITSDSSQGETGVQCPSTTQCTVVEFDTEYTFNPATPSAVTSAKVGTSGAFRDLACPTTTLCAAEDQGSPAGIVTFNPQTGAVIGTRFTPDAANYVYSFACASAGMCTVVDNQGNEVTFDPSTGTITSGPKLIASGGLGVLACPSTTLCTAAAGSKVVSFNPGAGAIISGPTAIGLTSGFSGLSCASTAQCTGVTYDGNEVTFDPSTETVASGPTVIDSATAIDGTTASVNAVSCPTTGQCTTVDYIGDEVTFNPISIGSPTPALVDGATSLNAVACPSATQCTAVDTIGRVVTFNPLSPGNPTSVLIDPGPNFLNNPPGLSSIACPSVSQCTLVDMNGNEVTFDPTRPAATAATTAVDSYSLSAVACPTTAQCSAVDYAGGEVTFNPNNPGSPTVSYVDADGDTLIGLACPTASQCTTADTAGGQEITFDPNNPTATPAPVDIYAGYNLNTLDCPSATLCAAIDYNGNELTFNPQSPPSTDPPLTLIDPLNQDPSAIACPSVSECVATDYNGAAIVGDPTSSAAWSVDQITGASALLGAGCFNADECVVVDQVGNAFVGITVPSATTAPSITGRPIAGLTLTAGHGTWTLAPDSYAEQWLRCDTSGNNCTPISGATSQTYTLTNTDIGHTIRVQETATNRAGAGTPSRSSATAAVTGQPANSSPPTLTGQATPGQTLTEAHGTWLNGVTSYAYKWMRCDTTGNTCAAITGATAQTYKLTSADVGHTIRVQETASNAVGASTPATSQPSGVVTAVTPAVSSFHLTNPVFAVSGASTPLFATAARHHQGTTFKYTLNEAATAKIVISQRLRGRHHHIRIVRRGTLTRTSHTGANSVAFTGRIGTKRLKPGRYQATVTATTAAKKSKPHTIRFQIVAR